MFDSMPIGALAGLRVLDLSRVLAGPWASQLLADLGADVVKVERPEMGDDTRAWGPPWLQGEDGPTAESAYFICANRNKRSVTADLSSPQGQTLVRSLASKADVVIENFKVGGLRQYGLDHESLREADPSLIYCSITGFGQTGPYAARPGYDFLIQGLGGLMSLTGRPNGQPGAGPMKVGVALTDIMTGLYSTVAILAALTHRQRTGEGQHIDMSLLDVQVACLANQASNFLVGGTVPQRLGNAHPNIVPYQDFATADGYMIIAVGNDGQFANLCKALGHPAWAADERFATNPARVAHRAEIIDQIGHVTATRTTAAWIAEMERVGVPCGPINTMNQVFDDPQVQARGMRVAMTHASAAAVNMVANPIRLSATPVSYRSAPPLLGQHTNEVLADWLGMDAEKSPSIRQP
jgi:crotonobetainyl-CoA:carnitine CoA-transferase CaiB-like acyl-CoA transferase